MLLASACAAVSSALYCCHRHRWQFFCYGGTRQMAPFLGSDLSEQHNTAARAAAFAPFMATMTENVWHAKNAAITNRKLLSNCGSHYACDRCRQRSPAQSRATLMLQLLRALLAGQLKLLSKIVWAGKAHKARRHVNTMLPYGRQAG